MKNIAEIREKFSAAKTPLCDENETEDEVPQDLPIKVELPENKHSEYSDLDNSDSKDNSQSSEALNTGSPLNSIDKVIKSERPEVVEYDAVVSHDCREVKESMGKEQSSAKTKCIFCGEVTIMAMWKSHMYKHHKSILSQDDTLFDESLSHTALLANKVKCLSCNCVVLIKFFAKHLHENHSENVKSESKVTNLRRKVMCLICMETVTQPCYSDHLKKFHPAEEESIKKLTKNMVFKGKQEMGLMMKDVEKMLLLECVYCDHGNILRYSDYDLHLLSLHPLENNIQKRSYLKRSLSSIAQIPRKKKKSTGRKSRKGNKTTQDVIHKKKCITVDQLSDQSEDGNAKNELIASNNLKRKLSEHELVLDADSNDTVFYTGEETEMAANVNVDGTVAMDINDDMTKEVDQQPLKGECPYCGMISVYTTVKVHMYKTHYEEIMNEDEPGGIERTDKRVLKIICCLCNKEVFRKYLPIHMASEHPEHYIGGTTCTVDVCCLLCRQTIKNRQYRPHLKEKHPEMLQKLEILVRKRGTSGTVKPKKIDETVSFMEINCVYCRDNKTVNYMKYRDHVSSCHPGYSKMLVKNISIVKRTLNPKKTLAKKNKTARSAPNPILQKNREYLTIDRMACLPPLPTPPREYYCASCDERFFTKRSYKKHASDTHKYPKDHVYVCNYCYQLFETVAKGQNHEDEVHALERYQCETCGKLFTRASSLRMHKECIHLGIKRIRKTPRRFRDHICSYCGKIYKLAAVLENHIMRAHKHEKNMCCDECDKRFVDKSELTKHKLTHLDKKDYKYQCSYCSYKAVRKHIMVYHERIHTGEKPYLCNLCGSRHRIGLTFRSHMLNKHGIELHGSEEHQKYYHPEIPVNLGENMTQNLQEPSDSTDKQEGDTTVTACLDEKMLQSLDQEESPTASIGLAPSDHVHSLQSEQHLMKLRITGGGNLHAETNMKDMNISAQHSQIERDAIKVPIAKVQLQQPEESVKDISGSNLQHTRPEKNDPFPKDLPLPRIQRTGTNVTSENLGIPTQTMSSGYFKPSGSAYHQADTFQHFSLPHYTGTAFPQMTHSEASSIDYSRLSNLQQEWAHDSTGMSLDRFNELNQAYRYYASTLQGNMDKTERMQQSNPGPKDYNDQHQ